SDVCSSDLPVLAAHHHLAAQRLEDVLIGGVGLGQHGGVEHVHVGGGDVLDGDDAQQVALRADHRQGVDVPVPHDLPGAAEADGAVHPFHLAVIHVADLGVDVGAHPGRLHPELLQDKLGLLVHLAGAAGLADQVAGPVFQLRIGDGGTDGIGIRVAVADDHHFMGFFWHTCIYLRWFWAAARAPCTGSRVVRVVLQILVPIVTYPPPGVN